MTIPVIILNYNSAADCRKCISSLKKQEGIRLEIIIVDNCSRADDAEKVVKVGVSFDKETRTIGDWVVKV